MSHGKTEDDWTVLINEYSVCKKKLQSKKDAVKILVKDLEQCQVERDIYKNKICQLQQELDELKDLLGGYWRSRKQNGAVFCQEEDNNKKIKVLKQLLEHVREENQALHNDIKSVKQLYLDSQNDNQLLREAISKHETQQKENSIKTQDKARLIDQLEETQNKIDNLQRELFSVNDEKNELIQERDYFKEKSNRLNTELNYVLYNDEKRIVDVDALILENKYLKEVTKQYKEEKLLAVATSLRYKEALEQRKDKSSKFLASLDLPNNCKAEVDHQSNNATKTPHRLRLGSNSETITELQRVAKSLTEMLSEKDIALKHQRNTNRILGTRVKELEKKLKTLEISGLWSLQGGCKDRRMELRLEEHLRQNQAEEKASADKMVEELDRATKSPTLSRCNDEEESSDNNNICAIKEGVLLDISERKNTSIDESETDSASVFESFDEETAQTSDEIMSKTDDEDTQKTVVLEEDDTETAAEDTRQVSSCPPTPFKYGNE